KGTCPSDLPTLAECEKKLGSLLWMSPPEASGDRGDCFSSLETCSCTASLERGCRDWDGSNPCWAANCRAGVSRPDVLSTCWIELKTLSVWVAALVSASVCAFITTSTILPTLMGRGSFEVSIFRIWDLPCCEIELRAVRSSSADWCAPS